MLPRRRRRLPRNIRSVPRKNKYKKKDGCSQSSADRETEKPRRKGSKWIFLGRRRQIKPIFGQLQLRCCHNKLATFEGNVDNVRAAVCFPFVLFLSLFIALWYEEYSMYSHFVPNVCYGRENTAEESKTEGDWWKKRRQIWKKKKKGGNQRYPQSRSRPRPDTSAWFLPPTADSLWLETRTNPVFGKCPDYFVFFFISNRPSVQQSQKKQRIWKYTNSQLVMGGVYRSSLCVTIMAWGGDGRPLAWLLVLCVCKKKKKNIQQNNKQKTTRRVFFVRTKFRRQS